jgi:hypothetical protein
VPESVGENERLRGALERIAAHRHFAQFGAHLCGGSGCDPCIAKHALTSTPSGAALSEEEKGTPE